MGYHPFTPYSVSNPYAAAIPPQSPHQQLVDIAPAPPSSPIKSREPDRVLQEFSLWLKDFIDTNRYSIVETEIRTIIDQGFTIDDIRDLPVKYFVDIGVKGAIFPLIKPHLRTFKRQYKQRQKTQAATSLTEVRTQGKGGEVGGVARGVRLSELEPEPQGTPINRF